jgi:exopolysaccharide biosynthesis WecB/TagA/CpsF family protein
MMHLKIKGIPITSESSQVLVSRLIEAMVLGDVFWPIVTFNITMFGAHAPHRRGWLIRHALITPDGIGVSILLWLKYRQWVPRYPGIDMVNDILTQSPRGQRVALIGASSTALNGAQAWVQSQGHSVVFAKNGYASLSDADMTALINGQPQLILVAKGCPEQDEVIYYLSRQLSSGVAIGVGGAFDIWSGTKRRAPQWLRWMGLEWLFRLLGEPSRIYRLVRAMGYILMGSK